MAHQIPTKITTNSDQLDHKLKHDYIQLTIQNNYKLTIKKITMDYNILI